jgi:predicted nucleotidyltransferase
MPGTEAPLHQYHDTCDDSEAIERCAIMDEVFEIGGFNMNHEQHYPDAPSILHKVDLERAVRILQEEGCREIYLFGSVATGDAGPDSDIDIGIRDYPRERFFHIFGRLLTELEHETDLIDFGRQTALFSLLTDIGEVRRIA